MIDIKTFAVGMMSTNSYVVTDRETQHTALIDPGCKDAGITSALDTIGKENVKYILLTHGHFDHIACAREYADMFGAEIVISAEDAPFLSDNSLNLSVLLGPSQLKPFYADITLKDGDTLNLGDTTLSFLLTPGHTAGSGCFVSHSDKIIFSGDTLFCGSMGRTDFPTGDFFRMQKSLHRLRDLNGDYIVYPGHDISTTLSYERENNIYLRT